MQRINSLKPLNSNSSNNGAASIHTPQAVDVNHTQIVPQQVQGLDILEKLDTNAADEGSSKAETQNESIKQPVVEKTALIPGGYYIKARCIQESEIAHAPPHVREIWDFLIKEANHKNGKKHGTVIERGQCIRSYKDIQDALAWYVGWQKKTYSKCNCETAMKWLTKRNMITKKKTTRGLVITVINYDAYQNPKNYETDKETYKRTTMNLQSSDTINKNDKNIKNEKEVYTPAFEEFWKLYPKKLGKGKAFEKWKSLKVEKNGLYEKVMASVIREVPLRSARGEVQYVQNPATWLNCSGWEDEPPAETKKGLL